MEAWVAFQRSLPRGLFNPCGSTRIREVAVLGTRAQRTDLAYTDITARFVLEVYDFTPYKDPDTAECRGPARRE